MAWRQLLRTFGADVNAKGWYDETPQFCAAGGGHEKVAELLLKNGADIKAENYYGTALHVAARNGHTEVVKLLLLEGADINTKDEEREFLPSRSDSLGI